MHCVTAISRAPSSPSMGLPEPAIYQSTQSQTTAALSVQWFSDGLHDTLHIKKSRWQA